jgi:hypothetical protein
MCRKIFLTVLIFSFIIQIVVSAQENRDIKAVDERSPIIEQLIPIAGSDLLREKDIEVAEFLRTNPGYLEHKKLTKSAWSFVVGTGKSWLAYNFTNSQSYAVASTCRAVGTNCYIFVANDVWNSTVDQDAVNAVVSEFDNHTPANESKGIYQTCIETYGNPPDVDSDSKIVILILDIIDGYTGNGGYVGGYFTSGNEIGGNSAEIYFMDSNPANLLSEQGLNTAFETAAHEFQHMINWNYHQTSPELTFINEGLSKSAEIICGYGASMQGLYANETNHYLFDWRSDDLTLALNDYARAQRFFLYLMEQFGVSSLKEFVQAYNTYGLTGIAGLNRVLGAYSTSLGKVFLNWEIANGLNDITVDPAFGYTYGPLPLSIGTIHHNPNINPSGSTVINLGAEYFTFTNSSDLSVTFSAGGSNIIVKAIEIGETAARIVDVPINSSFNETSYPSVYHTIRFAVIDTNQTFSQAYQYQASGTPLNTSVELKWDESEPVGYLPLPPGDTVCVVFDAFSEGNLDSIKVGLRQAGSIEGGIWEYNLSWNPSPLGAKLSNTFTAYISTTPPNPPYPVPWPNWSSVNLSSSNISTEFPFAVAFALPVDSNPNVMVSIEESDFTNSLSYSTEYSQWVRYSAGEDSTYEFLIRAYVSIISGTVKKTIELIPASYSLHQNYPNPFNPETKIRYSIPESGQVSLTIYDITGRKIAELINEFQNSGSYEIAWNGKNGFGESVPSGIYLYSIKAGNFTQTNKMILLK